MKQLVVVFIIFLSSLQLFAQQFGLQWVDHFVGTNATNNIQNVNFAFDNSGNIYAAFTFIGTVDFDPSGGTYNQIAGSEDIFVAKYTTDGELTTDRFALLNAGYQAVNDIVIDSQGNIYIAGTASGLVNYSPSGITANVANVGTTGKDIFIAKYTETGQFVWVKTYGSATDAEGLSLAIDGADNLYLAGKFRGTMSVNPGGVTSSISAQGSLSDIFLAKFQSSGTLTWVYRFGETGDDVANDVYYDPSSQSIFITGAYQGTVDFDPGQGEVILSSTVFADNSYLAKYSTAGIIDWAISFGGGNSLGNGIAVDDNSNAYVTGYFQTGSPGADFDPSPSNNAFVIAKGVPDSYIAKYDVNGNYEWAKSMGAGFGVGGGLSITPNNQLIATGVFGGNIDFGTTQVKENVSQTASYIARFEEDGTFLDHATITQSNNLEHIMKEGNLIIGGRLRGTAEFDPINEDDAVTSSSTYGTYFAKYDATPPLLKTNSTATPTLGADLLVSIELEDKETGVTAGGALIKYRGVSENSNAAFKQVTLNKKTGNVFEGTIPSDDFDGLGIEFFGVAANSVGVVGATSALITRNFNVPDGLAIPQRGTGNGSQEDYRIVSIPLDLTNKSVKSIFEDDLGPYNPNEYRLFSYGDKTTELNASSNLEAGKGYWLIVAGNDRAINTGTGRTVTASKSAPFSIQLNPGWNLIGNPYNFNISWADMKTTNPALTEDLRVFNGSFSNGTRLDAMSGGFVFANDTKTIFFPVVKNSSANSGRVKDEISTTAEPPLQPGDWEVALNISKAEASYHLGGIGMRADAKVDYDPYDEVSLPRFINYLEINHHKKIHGHHFSKDIVPIEPEQIWEFKVESAQPGLTTISWDPALLTTLHHQLVLIDMDAHWPVDMITHSSYTFESNGTRHFKAVYGDYEFVKEESLPDEFRFYGLHPNPAHAKTTITFSAPDTNAGNEAIAVRLYSTLGQKMLNFAYPITDSGIQELELPLSNASLKPGVYIVEIQFGEIRKQSRLLIK